MRISRSSSSARSTSNGSCTHRSGLLKSWKLTDEDWRNREKRPLYEEAVADMLERTDHTGGRWHVIPGDSKKYARVAVIETVNAELERAMREHGVAVPPPHDDDDEARRRRPPSGPRGSARRASAAGRP